MQNFAPLELDNKEFNLLRTRFDRLENQTAVADVSCLDLGTKQTCRTNRANGRPVCETEIQSGGENGRWEGNTEFSW